MVFVDSPCTNVCTIDRASGLCVGCGRTLREIADWLALDATERRRIMSELPQRMIRRDTRRLPKARLA
jgi:predicted Fe-S protein YdhL (DUF1289 family)